MTIAFLKRLYWNSTNNLHFRFGLVIHSTARIPSAPEYPPARAPSEFSAASNAVEAIGPAPTPQCASEHG